MEPDLSRSYSELNLPLDCTLEEFKCAYRRRIAELHPDRKGENQASPEAQAALFGLISTYVAVNQFHRRYGRMPGGASPRASAAARATGGGGDSGPLPMTPRTSLPVPVPSNYNDTNRSTRPTWKFVILVLVVLILLSSWDWLTLASQ